MTTKYVTLWIYLNSDENIDRAMKIAGNHFPNYILNPNLQTALDSGCVAISWNNILVGKSWNVKKISKQIQDEIGDCEVNCSEQGDNEGFLKKHPVIIAIAIGLAGIAATVIVSLFNPFNSL